MPTIGFFGSQAIDLMDSLIGYPKADLKKLNYADLDSTSADLILLCPKDDKELKNMIREIQDLKEQYGYLYNSSFCIVSPRVSDFKQENFPSSINISLFSPTLENRRYLYERIDNLLTTHFEKVKQQQLEQKMHEEKFASELRKEKNELEFFSFDKEQKLEERPGGEGDKKSESKWQDHLTLNRFNRIAAASMLGKRKANEDEIAMGSLENFDKLTSEQRQEVIRETIDELKKIVGQRRVGLEAGSTFCLSILCEDKMYVGNVGDSMALLAGKKIQRVNELHTPTERKEAERLSKFFEEKTKEFCNSKSAPVDLATFGKKKSIKGDYLIFPETPRRKSLMLQTSQSYGDEEFDKIGHICVGNVYEIILTDEKWALVVCDGARENVEAAATDPYHEYQTGADDEEIQAAIKDATPDLDGAKKVAKSVAQSAFKNGKGSKDNISVIATPIDLDIPGVRFMAVFDGHCGKEVAIILRQNLHPILQAKIDQKLKLGREAEHAALSSIGDDSRSRRVMVGR